MNDNNFQCGVALFGEGGVIGRMDVYCLYRERELDRMVFERLLEWVSADKRVQILRYRRYEDAQRSLLGDLLARYALCLHMDTNNKRLSFGKNAFGKPLLMLPNAPCFNISHAGDWVVCAVDHDFVGIDVEEMRDAPTEVADRFFSPDERLALQCAPESARKELFYQIWTLKESYIKAVGMGLSMNLAAFTVQPGTNLIVHHDRIERCSHWNKALDDRYMLAVCGQAGAACKEITLMVDEFIAVIPEVLGG